jgi:hypothetical protein
MGLRFSVPHCLPPSIYISRLRSFALGIFIFLIQNTGSEEFIFVSQFKGLNTTFRNFPEFLFGLFRQVVQECSLLNINWLRCLYKDSWQAENSSPSRIYSMLTLY